MEGFFHILIFLEYRKTKILSKNDTGIVKKSVDYNNLSVSIDGKNIGTRSAPVIDDKNKHNIVVNTIKNPHIIDWNLFVIFLKNLIHF